MLEGFSNPLNDYLEATASPEPDYLRQIRAETTEQVHSPHMLSGHHQGRLLALISKLLRPKTILEIGTYTGYSALCLAEGLVEEGQLVTIEKDSNLSERILRNINLSPFASRIKLLNGDAHQVLAGLDLQPDLVFIDADKRGYSRYFEALVPRMPSGGVLLADNVLWSGMVLDPGEDKKALALHHFNEQVAKDARVEAVILPIRDGLTLIRKK
ncbi:MAG: O-methyltransferase [Cyclobacteriaceae bacterium]|jgi:predicted O-methyltransferase YrrM